MHTTAWGKERPPRTFRFIMFPPPFCEKMGSPSGLSNCETRPTHTSATRLHLAASDNLPGLDVRRSSRRSGTSHGIDCVEENIPQRHSNQLREFLFHRGTKPLIT